MEYFLNTCGWKRKWIACMMYPVFFFPFINSFTLETFNDSPLSTVRKYWKIRTFTFWRGNIKSSNHKSKSGPYEKYLKIKFFLQEKQRGWGRTLRGEALNTAVFPDKLSGAWGGFGADRRSCSSLPRPPGGADWINSSLRASRSLRGHRGNAGWGGKMEGL